MGYIKYSFELSVNPMDGELDYLALGLMILLAPVGAPLYWIGRVVAWIVND